MSVCSSSVQLVVGGGGRLDEGRHSVAGAPVHAVQHQAVQVDVELGSRAEALDQRHGPAVALARIQPGAVQQMARDHAQHHLQHRRDQLGLRGQQQVQRGLPNDGFRATNSRQWMTPMGRFEPLGDGRGSRSEKADNGAELAGAADTVSSAPDTVSEFLDALLIPSSQAEGRSSCREEAAKAGYIARGRTQRSFMLSVATVAMTVSGDFSWQKDPLSTCENGPAVDNRVGVRGGAVALRRA
jgi:hypothetical protein